MNAYVNYIILLLNLFTSLCNKNNGFDGVYFGKLGDDQIRLELRTNGSFSYYQGRYGSLFYRESEGSWRVVANFIELNSFAQYDSTLIDIRYDTTLVGLKIRIIDFNYSPLNSQIVFNEEKLNTENGEVNLPAVEAGIIKIFFNDIQHPERSDTVNIFLKENNHKIVTVQHINTVEYENYRFFKRAILKCKGKKLKIPNDLDYEKMILKGQ